MTDFFENMFDNLGKPDKDETFEEDGYVYKKLTWDTPSGSIVKVVLISSPYDKKPSLEEELKKAVEDEMYEKAAEIRDRIKIRDKHKN